MTRPPTIYVVPAGTDARPCDGPTCTRTIYWIKTAAGRPLPIDCHAGAGCVPPTEDRPGSGVPHWGTCADAEYFRARAKQNKRR